ncbi:MAG: helix-turn-helix domain-containing protein [Janthinobacterium lividum]
MQSVIPSFYLYGDELTDVERSFLHVETIQRRSSVNDWRIRPHAHPEHHQILLLTEGSGSVRFEDQIVAFEPQALVILPALCVHEFRFEPGSDGCVVTVSTVFLSTALEGDATLGAAFEGHGTCFDRPDADPDLHDAFQALHREFLWGALGRRMAVKAHLQRILVAIARLSAAAPAEVGTKRRQSDIVARFRGVVECEFRRQLPLPAYANQLGITTAGLNAACRATTGKSALQVVHDRIMIESKRSLLYTGMTIAEISTSLGFADPAYFSRFFSQRVGSSPAAFRATAQTQA